MFSTYLDVQIIDLGDGRVNVPSVDSLSDLHASLNGLLFSWKLDISLFGKLFSSPRVALADEVVHNDEVDVPEQDKSARVSQYSHRMIVIVCRYQNTS